MSTKFKTIALAKFQSASKSKAEEAKIIQAKSLKLWVQIYHRYKYMADTNIWQIQFQGAFL